MPGMPHAAGRKSKILAMAYTKPPVRAYTLATYQKAIGLINLGYKMKDIRTELRISESAITEIRRLHRRFIDGEIENTIAQLRTPNKPI